jgi:hypothetical protein
MKRICRKWLLVALIICSIAVFINGCTTMGVGVQTGPNDRERYKHPPAAKNGPPAHAPAHGYRAKHRYRYYPSCSVYFDIGRAVYFYLEGDNWRASVELPNHLRVRLGGSVVIEMESDRPYIKHKHHQQKYPPGQLKKKKSKKWAKSIKKNRH